MNIKVTNYKKGWKGKPIQEVHPDARLELEGRELSINECLFIHVFDKLPYVRNIDCNKMWFESNIYHL